MQAGADADRWASLVRWLRFRIWVRRHFWPGHRAGSHHAYTPGSLEQALYNPSVGQTQGTLLNVHEIISPDRGVTASTRLLRFLADAHVQIADVALLMIALGTTICAPLTFIWGGCWADPELVPGGWSLLVFDMLLDIVYAAYLALRLNMSFLHPARHTEVVDRSQICRWWLRSPLYWSQVLSTTCYVWIIPGASLFLNGVKCVRISHFVWLPDSLWRVSESRLCRLLRPAFLLVACSHWVACVLAYVGGYRVLLTEGHDASGEPQDFSLFFGGRPVPGGLALYMQAFVEAIYMLTGALDNPLGDGGPRNKSFVALVIVSVLCPVGCIVVALFISAVVQEQAMVYALDVRHEENKAFMQRALRILAIPDALQQRVLSMHYYQKMGHDHEAFNELFSKKNLSPPLESALLVYLYRDTVCGSRYFCGKDSNYIIAVIRVLENQVFLPGDYVARRGEVASAMYFVSRGRLSVLVPDVDLKTRLSRSKQVRVLQEGDHFGEVALVQQSVRTAWVRADSYVLVAGLHRQQMEGLWAYFENERMELVNMVLKTAQQDRQRDLKERFKRAATSLNLAGQRMSQITPEPALAQGPAPAEEMSPVVPQEPPKQAALLQPPQRALPAGPGGPRPAEPAGTVGPAQAAELGRLAEGFDTIQRCMEELLDRQTALELGVSQALGELRSAAPPRKRAGRAKKARAAPDEAPGEPPPAAEPPESGAVALHGAGFEQPGDPNLSATAYGI